MRKAISLSMLAVLQAATVHAEDIEAGAALYGRYCATCHGKTGLGDGPTARIISVKPADLVGLTASSGGVFPLVRVIERIDGRQELVAHGSPMPFYGAFFDTADMERVEVGHGAVEVSAPVLAIARFLETIQQR